jgi:hypothetical protein
MMPHTTTTIIQYRYSALTNIDKQHRLSTSNNSGSGGAATTTTIDQSFATTISYNSHSMRLTRWHDCTVLVRQPLKTRKTSTPKITNKEDWGRYRVRSKTKDALTVIFTLANNNTQQ